MSTNFTRCVCGLPLETLADVEQHEKVWSKCKRLYDTCPLPGSNNGDKCKNSDCTHGLKCPHPDCRERAPSKQKSQAQIHFQTHLDRAIRPKLSCSECGVQYLHSNHLKDHWKKKHAGPMPSQGGSGTLVPSPGPSRGFTQRGADQGGPNDAGRRLQHASWHDPIVNDLLNLAPTAPHSHLSNSQSVQFDVSSLMGPSTNPSQAYIDASVAAASSAVYSGQFLGDDTQDLAFPSSQNTITARRDVPMSGFNTNFELGDPAVLQTLMSGSYGVETDFLSTRGNKRAAEDSLNPRPSKHNSRHESRESLVGFETESFVRSHDNYVWIIKSLGFTERRSRLAKIRNSSEGTSEWIFDNATEPDHGFSRWLRSDHGVYLILGKAGSGKSTLLKHIVNHEQCNSLLEEWSTVNGERHKLITATFCFWRAGSDLQRKMQGLYRSLLAQILEQHPVLTPTALPEHWKRPDHYVWSLESEQQSWDVDQLREALFRTVNTNTNLRFCFFIDGLDEYVDELHELIKDLETLSKESHVKICITSRHSVILVQDFKKRPRLTLEQFTKPDMRHYIQLKLEPLERYKSLQLKDPERVKSIIDHIMYRSQGVFLWIYLVIERLVRELRYIGTLEELEAEIRSLPKGLEHLIKGVMDRIDPDDRMYTARLLFMLDSYGPLSDDDVQKTIGWAYSLIEEHQNPSLVFQSNDSHVQDDDLGTDNLDDVDLSDFSTRAEARVQRWCHDLIEFQKVPKNPYQLLEVLDHETVALIGGGKYLIFAHRTVYDYVKKHRQTLAQYAGVTFQAPQAACRMSLLHLRKILKAATAYKRPDTPDSDRPVFDCVAHVLRDVQKLEMTTDESDQTPSVVLHALNRMLSSYWQSGHLWPFFFTQHSPIMRHEAPYFPSDTPIHKYWILILAPCYRLPVFLRQELARLRQQSPRIYKQICPHILYSALRTLCGMDVPFRGSDCVLKIARDLLIHHEVDINTEWKPKVARNACTKNHDIFLCYCEDVPSDETTVEWTIWTEVITHWRERLSHRPSLPPRPIIAASGRVSLSRDTRRSIEEGLHWKNHTIAILRLFVDIGADFQLVSYLPSALVDALILNHRWDKGEDTAPLDANFAEFSSLLEHSNIDTTALHDTWERAKAQAAAKFQERRRRRHPTETDDSNSDMLPTPDETEEAFVRRMMANHFSLSEEIDRQMLSDDDRQEDEVLFKL